MESKQYKHNTIKNVLKLINSFYKKCGFEKIKELDFDIDCGCNLFNFKVVQSMETVLKTDMECDLKITPEFLEKVKAYINGL